MGAYEGDVQTNVLTVSRNSKLCLSLLQNAPKCSGIDSYIPLSARFVAKVSGSSRYHEAIGLIHFFVFKRKHILLLWLF